MGLCPPAIALLIITLVIIVNSVHAQQNPEEQQLIVASACDVGSMGPREVFVTVPFDPAPPKASKIFPAGGIQVGNDFQEGPTTIVKVNFGFFVFTNFAVNPGPDSATISIVADDFTAVQTEGVITPGPFTSATVTVSGETVIINNNSQNALVGIYPSGELIDSRQFFPCNQ